MEHSFFARPGRRLYVILDGDLTFITVHRLPRSTYLFHFLYCSASILHIDEKARAQKN